jgi:hypothetical protein
MMVVFWGMYGKHYISMYEGSMIGAGSAYFAVWGYIIAHMSGAWVELNPQIIAFVLGEKVEVVEEVLGRMQEPDSRSRSQEEGGRKLVKLGEYAYRVVNGMKYRSIRNEEARRNYQRNWIRAKRRNSKPLPGEQAYVKAQTEEEKERVLERHLPSHDKEPA